MADRLGEYRRKRRFEETPEPAGGDGGAPGEARFVIQEHHARRLHWDLRLEHEGTLASWALPRGLPEDPKGNRKAVRTEDHPLEYLDFHGEIPKGSYGAGTMTIWDQGTYECEKWRDDEVIVVFHGERARGRYVLFRAGAEKDWMIHRMDPPADPGREPLPEGIAPMLARLGGLPREDGGWAYEIKWDGVRAIAYCEPGKLRLEARSLTDITARYPELRALTRALGSRQAVLDGELVAFDGEGRPSFEALQGRMHLSGEAQIRRRAEQIPVTYVIFDVLHLDGRTLLGAPYAERRELLASLDLNGPNWRTPASHIGDGAALLAASAQQGLEGIVAKRLDSPYEQGRRSACWIKVKNKNRDEFVIGGWLPEKNRAARLGALLVGERDEDGELRYRGKVGTGWDAAERERLEGILRPLARETSPFSGRQPQKGALHVEPMVLAEIEFAERTSQGMLRHPSYKGTREDKGAPLELPDVPVGKAAEVLVEGRPLRFSNLGKVLYPESGFTKGDVVSFYAAIAPALLPHLRGHPMTLLRYPDGVQGEFFYEKNCPSHRPDWLATAKVPSSRRGTIEYCLYEDLPSLLWAANLASLEMHPLLQRHDDPATPVMVVFDLDPGPPAGIVECCDVAIRLRGMLDGLGLRTFPKTSGSKGMQIALPLNTEVSFAQTKPFAQAVAETLERAFPDLVVSRMTKSLRPGKVLVDWSQNDEHKTTVAVHSLRAKRDPPLVSTPLEWDEVEAALKAGKPERLEFSPAQALARVEKHGDLWAEVLTLRQTLPG